MELSSPIFDCADDPSQETHWPRIDWPLVVICVIGMVLRLAWLRQPMRYDESTTFLDIAQGGFWSILTQYGPNNHVLHTLLVHASTLWTSREWAIRLPAFVAGVAMIPLAAMLGNQLFHRPAGLFGAALVACSGHLIEYSTNARGYSMVADFTLLQVMLADQVIRRARHRDFAAFAVVTALGFFTIPTMLYPAMATLAWAMLLAIINRRRIAWRRFVERTLGYAVLGGLLIVLVYTPILLQPQGLHNLFGNRWIAPIESGWVEALVRVAGEVLHEWSLGLTMPGLVAVFLLASVSISNGFIQRDARPAWVIVAFTISIAVMAIQRVVPFARVFSFALPMLLITAGGGAGIIFSTIVPARIASVTVILCGTLAMYVLLAKVPDRSSEFDKFPAAAQIVKFLAPRVVDNAATTICGVVASAPMRYACLRARRPAFVYQAGAGRLLLVTRNDEAPSHVLTSNRLRPDDFKRIRLIFSKGVARVYELVPVAGRTPRAHRLPATLP